MKNQSDISSSQANERSSLFVKQIPMSPTGGLQSYPAKETPMSASFTPESSKHNWTPPDPPRSTQRIHWEELVPSHFSQMTFLSYVHGLEKTILLLKLA